MDLAAPTQPRIGAQALARLGARCLELASTDDDAASGPLAQGLLGTLDEAGCAGLLVDPAGQVLCANDAAYTLFARPAGSLAGEHLAGLLPGPPAGARSGQRGDGRRFPAEVGLHACRLGATTVQLVTVLDASAGLHERGLAATVAMVASSADALVSKDLDGRITAWNEAAERIFGYRAAEAIGRPITILFPPERLAEELEILERLGRGEQVSDLRTTRLHRDGRQLEVLQSVAPVHDARGRLVGATALFRDLTRQRSAERAAEQLAALNSAILENATYAIATVDPDGIFTSFNRAAELALGYSAAELVGRQSVAVVHDPAEVALRARELGRQLGRDLRPGMELFTGAAGSGPHADQRWTFVRRDGTRFSGRLSVGALRDRQAEVTGYLGILFDLSEQHAAEADAARERERSAAILANALDGIHILDEQDRLVFCSDSFAELVARTPGQLRGAHASEWLPEAPADFSAGRAGSARQRSFETRYRRPDGSEVDVEVGYRGVVLGGQRCLYASARDISARRRLELERVEHLRELERVNQQLEGFAAAAAHDLRSPLRGAALAAEWILEDDDALAASSRARLQLIQERMQRMVRMLDDMLDYARIDARHLAAEAERAAPSVLVAEALALLALPASMQVQQDAALAGLPAVPRMPLQRVFANLIDNAARHHDRPAGTIRIGGGQRGRWLHFTVSDDGPGIPPGSREAIFEMFHTLQPRDAREGSGMGLALVRRMLEVAGGRCGVEPAGGRGSVFWFDWPL